MRRFREVFNDNSSLDISRLQIPGYSFMDMEQDSW